MSVDKFQLSDIKNEFWRWLISEVAGTTDIRKAELLYCEIHKRTGGQVPWLAYEPIRIARDRYIIAGEPLPDHLTSNLSARQVSRIKNPA